MSDSVDRMAEEVVIGKRQCPVDHLPSGVHLDEALGLVVAEGLSGQIVHHRPGSALYETRATRTPGGEYLLMFPAALPGFESTGHYNSEDVKCNELVAYRSKDQGRSWQGPTVPMDIPYSQHGFIPLIPAGSGRLYCFGTQPMVPLWHRRHGQGENAPIGYRYSDDDGHHWSEVRLIRPTNDPDFTGMSVMRMCETASGTWLLGSHEGDWSYRPLQTRQYVLRSADQGQSWQVLPHPRHGGWAVLQYGRMDEGRPIHLGDDRVLMMLRTPEGHLWQTRSDDDGQTWSDPKPTTLVHPDAPPMLFALSDGRLAAFHHNRCSTSWENYKGLGSNPEAFQDRAELWVSLSSDQGETWSEPRFVLTNALAPREGSSPFRSYQCSYMDMFVDEGVCHLFLPHRWERALHLTLDEVALDHLPTQAQL